MRETDSCNWRIEIIFNDPQFYLKASPFADKSFTSPPPDASKFEATSILGFPAAIIAEQLTKIETVSSFSKLEHIF